MLGICILKVLLLQPPQRLQDVTPKSGIHANQALPNIVLHVRDCDKVESRISFMFMFKGAEELLTLLTAGKTYCTTRLMCQECRPEFVARGKEFSTWKVVDIFQAPEDKQLVVVQEKLLSLSDLAGAAVGSRVSVGAVFWCLWTSYRRTAPCMAGWSNLRRTTMTITVHAGLLFGRRLLFGGKASFRWVVR